MIGVRRPSVPPSVCLSDVAYIGSNSKTKRPRKTKRCTGVPQVTCDSHTDFKVKSSNADLRSFDFTFNRLFMKLFKTKSIDVVKACQSFTGSEVPSCALKRKTDKFILRFNCVENTFCNFCSSM